MENYVTNGELGATAVPTIHISDEVFSRLSFDDKRSHLEGVLPWEKLHLISGDPEEKRLTRAMQPQEFYWLFKEIGVQDAMDLLGQASPEQCLFVLDMELWKGWSFSEDKAVEYLGYILQGSEEHFLEVLPHLDFNLLSLFLGRELVIAGGIGDLNTDEERQTDWDHTFDDVFLIKFKNPKHTQIIGSFLDRVCRFDNRLYVALMESVSGEVDIESEEECYNLKSGRLADMGFPPHDEAVEIYSRINPDTYFPVHNKVLEQKGGNTHYPAYFLTGKSFLEQVLLRIDSDPFWSELGYLVTTALVADQAHLSDTEQMKAVVERVYGYLNIALEYLCRGDEVTGVEIITGKQLKSLFQLGFSIVLGLKFKAEKLSETDYATEKVLSGLKDSRPRFYRGLDSDGIDCFREFREMEDVRKMSDFLAKIRE